MRLPLLLILFLPAIPVQGGEWWAWSALEFWRNEDSKAWIFLGNRLDPEDGAYVQIISPRFRHAVLPWLDAGLGLSFLSIENTGTNVRFEQFRPELEINPHFEVAEGLELEWRNRMEWRWNEGDEFTVHRSRHRFQLSWVLPEPIGPMTRVFANNEVLIDLHRGEWTENRFVPLGTTFKAGPRSDLDVFGMILTTGGPAHWKHESVVGTYWRVRF